MCTRGGLSYPRAGIPTLLLYHLNGRASPGTFPMLGCSQVTRPQPLLKLVQDKMQGKCLLTCVGQSPELGLASREAESRAWLPFHPLPPLSLCPLHSYTCFFLKLPLGSSMLKHPAILVTPTNTYRASTLPYVPYNPRSAPHWLGGHDIPNPKPIPLSRRMEHWIV